MIFSTFQIRKLFEMVMNVFRVLKQEARENLATAFPIEEGMCGMTHVLQEYLLTKCALFVSNKWDEVPKGEFQNVKEVSIRKLKEIWPGFDPQITAYLHVSKICQSSSAVQCRNRRF